MSIININWDKENKLSNKALFIVIFSVLGCGFSLGVLLGVLI